MSEERVQINGEWYTLRPPPPGRRKGARMSTKLKAALHELRCRECRVTWRSWWQRLRDDQRGFDPFGVGERGGIPVRGEHR